ICGGQIAEAVAANCSDDSAVEIGRIDARRFVERFDDSLAYVIGVFLAQAHLFDVDAIPEAIDLIPRSSIDGFADLEAIAQWSIHANSNRGYTFARVNHARRGPSVIQKRGWYGPRWSRRGRHGRLI